MNLFKVLLLFFIILVNLDAIKSHLLSLEDNLLPNDNDNSFENNKTRGKRSASEPKYKLKKLHEYAKISDMKKVNKSLVEVPKMAGCEPTLTTVEFEHQLFDLMFPASTRVKRCSGCCLDSSRSCQPIKTRTRFFQVSYKRYIKGMDFSQLYKVVREVEEHVKCTCQCVIKADECKKAQVHNKNTCICECPNVKMKRDCDRLNSKYFYWDRDECQCKCLHVVECDFRSVFDTSVCQCIRRPEFQLN